LAARALRSASIRTREKQTAALALTSMYETPMGSHQQLDRVLWCEGAPDYIHDLPPCNFTMKEANGAH